MLLCVYQPSDILDIVVISAYKSHNAKYRFVSQKEILDVKQHSIRILRDFLFYDYDMLKLLFYNYCEFKILFYNYTLKNQV
jgi:hypothetical protein